MFKRIIFLIISLFLALPVLADDGSIIPVLWLFSQNKDPDWQEWYDSFKDISIIYQYNTNHEEIGYFEPFGSSIYQYNTKHEEMGYFEPFGSSIYQYNTNHEEIGYFEPFGSSIYQYNTKHEEIGYFRLF